MVPRMWSVKPWGPLKFFQIHEKKPVVFKITVTTLFVLFSVMIFVDGAKPWMRKTLGNLAPPRWY